MCGRYSLTQCEAQMLLARFGIENITVKLTPRFNISPTQDIAIIKNDTQSELSSAKFGLIPHWAKDPKTGYKMINARAETINEKPAYKKPFQNQRCLIIADSFYEWKTVGKTKTPYRIMLKDETVFAFAGIWENWNGIVTAAIVTTHANEFMTKIHERMPVILTREQEKKWLNGNADEALQLLTPINSDMLKAYQVSTKINTAKNESPDLIKEVSGGLNSFL